jgi:hypothetical protein
MQRCAHMLRSRRLRSHKRPRQTLPLCSEAHQKHRTRLQYGEHPTNDRSEHNARGTHSSRRPNRRGPEGPRDLRSRVENRPKAKPRPAAAAATSTQPRSASQRPTGRDPQSNRSPKSFAQVVVLGCLRALSIGIDLRSQHGRLVSARVSASVSVRKGDLGSCNRAATQGSASGGQGLPDRAAEEQACRPRRGGDRGFERPYLPGQNFSKCLLSLLPRHGVHRDRTPVTVHNTQSQTQYTG